jgi:hypothetical protein
VVTVDEEWQTGVGARDSLSSTHPAMQPTTENKKLWLTAALAHYDLDLADILAEMPAPVPITPRGRSTRKKKKVQRLTQEQPTPIYIEVLPNIESTVDSEATETEDEVQGAAVVVVTPPKKKKSKRDRHNQNRKRMRGGKREVVDSEDEFPLIHNPAAAAAPATATAAATATATATAVAEATAAATAAAEAANAAAAAADKAATAHATAPIQSGSWDETQRFSIQDFKAFANIFQPQQAPAAAPPAAQGLETPMNGVTLNAMSAFFKNFGK